MTPKELQTRDAKRDIGAELLAAVRAINFEAPTGHPPHIWTQEERNACQAAMHRILAAEEADPLGVIIWQLRQMQSALAFDPKVIQRAADLLAAIREATSCR